MDICRRVDSRPFKDRGFEGKKQWSRRLFYIAKRSKAFLCSDVLGYHNIYATGLNLQSLYRLAFLKCVQYFLHIIRRYVSIPRLLRIDHYDRPL